MILASLHILSHFAVPAIVARISFRKIWQRAWLIMCATIIIDIDHLLANPVYDPGRCSIGYHPLHTEIAIAIYGTLLLVPQLRIIAAGLLIHIALDALDCYRQAFFMS